MPPDKLPQNTIGKPTIYMDVEKYDKMLDDETTSPEQRRIALEQLWNFVVTCIDFGYGVHPMPTDCGQDENYTLNKTNLEQNLLYSESISLIEEFVENADAKAGTAKKGV